MQAAYDQIIWAGCVFLLLGGGGVLLVYWLMRKGWMSIRLIALGTFVFAISLGVMVSWLLNDARILLVALVVAILMGFRMLTNRQFIHIIETANQAISQKAQGAKPQVSRAAIPSLPSRYLLGVVLPYLAPLIGLALFAVLRNHDVGLRLGILLACVGFRSVLRISFFRKHNFPEFYTRAHLVADVLFLIVTWGGGLILILRFWLF